MSSVPIMFPWPARALHPNARVHFHPKAKAIKKARLEAAWLAKEAGWHRGKILGPVELWITFYPPDRRARDLDGMFSSCKAMVDGISDALGVNDSNFLFRINKAEARPHGVVEVRII